MSIQALLKAWMPAVLERDDDSAENWLTRALEQGFSAMPLHLCGTNFQLQVWRALLGIKPGHYMTYGQLAAELDRRGAGGGGCGGSEWVGGVCSCHRILPAGGGVGGYRWGGAIKAALFHSETATGLT